MPRKVIQTSYCTHLWLEDVLQTGLGMGKGMNITAHMLLPVVACSWQLAKVFLFLARCLRLARIASQNSLEA